MAEQSASPGMVAIPYDVKTFPPDAAGNAQLLVHADGFDLIVKVESGKYPPLLVAAMLITIGQGMMESYPRKTAAAGVIQ